MDNSLLHLFTNNDRKIVLVINIWKYLFIEIDICLIR